MTRRLRTLPGLDARALPMLTKADEPGEATAAVLGIPYLRVVDGRPTILRTTQEPMGSTARSTSSPEVAQ